MEADIADFGTGADRADRKDEEQENKAWKIDL